MATMPAPAEVSECPARNAIRATSTIRLALLPARISNSTRRVGVISDRGWSREFDDPIVLPEGKKAAHAARRGDIRYWPSKERSRAAGMAGRDRGAHARRRSRRTHPV